MRKILVIAIREYRAMVGTKAFILSIAMMPILMFGGLIAVDLLKDLNRSGERTIAVIDQTGQLFDRLDEAVAARNAAIASQSGADATNEFGRGGPASYVLEQIDVDRVNDDLRIELSHRIRNQELYAFVEIPPSAFDETASPTPTIAFHSQDAGLSGDREWLQMTINEFVKNDRLVKAGIDPGQVAAASKHIPVRSLGLFERTESGEIKAAEKDELSAIFLPMGVMMLMFMVIFLAAQPMLESVLEEKSQRIAEVLLGSANPFELMLGKLLGTVAGSLTVFGIYFIGGWIIAQDRGWTGMIPFSLLPWFVAFQILGVLFYASVFMAVGSACTQLKEAQSMLLPVWLVMMIPFFVWFHVVREPNSMLSIVLSFFPPATPSMMVLRLATGQTIPLWQPLSGMAVSVISTLICVLIAARIFRAGLLWQGKTPRLGEVLRWATARH